MLQKLVRTFLLGGAVCLLVVGSVLAQEIPSSMQYDTVEEYEKATGRRITEFNEAPMLRTRVAAGELPPVEKRLPEEPLVLIPYEKIGEYGGTIDTGGLGGFFELFASQEHSGLLEIDNDGKVCVNIVKGYDFSEDKQTLTLYLRKGLKWSDGMPCTADDILFWYEDILLNKEYTPAIPRMWKADGEVMKMEKIDDYTIQLHYVKPKPVIVSALSAWYSLNTFLHPWPKHYLKKWHTKYNPKADELAKEEGYEHWWEALRVHHNQSGWSQSDLDLPILEPWVLKKIAPDYRVFERNPYYWAVDPEGNQLPYIDKISARIMTNKEAYIMASVTGEFDFTGLFLDRKGYPLYKENEKQGNYRTLLWENTWANEEAYAFNLNNKDPILREIFQDVRFRQAMSLAINREEIRDIVFLGFGIPRQAAPNTNVSYYKEEWGTAYVEYDPEEANRLLDEMGLKWDKDHEYRLRPDGTTLTITIDMTEIDSPVMDVSELVKEYWEDVGVKTNLEMRERSFYTTRIVASEYDVCVWHIDFVSELIGYFQEANRLVQSIPAGTFAYANEWARWNQTDGKEGEEPPEKWKQFYKTIDDWHSTTSDEGYIRLAQEIYDFVSKNVLAIGTVAECPQIRLVRTNLRNVPEEARAGGDVWFVRSVNPPQWFFEE